MTETQYFQESRQVEVAFADLPVDASGRIDDKLMDSLEPFRIDVAKPLDMRYLAGFTADRFDQAKEDVAPRAERRMTNTAEAAAVSKAAKICLSCGASTIPDANGCCEYCGSFLG